MTTSRFWTRTGSDTRIGGRSRQSAWAHVGGGALAAWTPADDAALTLWHASGDWVDGGSGNASQWADSSSFARHSTQGTETLRPLIGPDYLRFDGVNDLLSGSPHIFAGGQARVFIVVSDYVVEGDASFFGEAVTTSTTSYYRLFTQNTFATGGSRAFVKNDAGATVLNMNTASPPETGAAVAIVERLDDGTGITALKNGSVTGGRTAYSGSVRPTITGLLTRRVGDILGNLSDVKVHEIIVTTDITTDTAALYRDYLAAKFGITL